VKHRFRIKNEEIEIEYEGSLKEVNERYKSAFEWLTSRQAGKKQKKKELKEGKEKKDKRGGIRKTIYGDKITELVDEGFFKKRKSFEEVIKGLDEKDVPTKDAKARNAILTNLRRRIKSKSAKLKGTTEEDIWYFWTD